MKRLELLQKSYKTCVLGEYHFKELEELKVLLKGKTIEEIKSIPNIYTFNYNQEYKYLDIQYKNIVGSVLTLDGDLYLSKQFDVYTSTEGFEDSDWAIPLMGKDYAL